jgi:hypothetical protein
MCYTSSPARGREVGMPWKESSVMDERMRFVSQLTRTGRAWLPCDREFSISRKTGYKIFERYEECGLEGLSDRTRRGGRKHSHVNGNWPVTRHVLPRSSATRPGRSNTPRIAGIEIERDRFADGPDKGIRKDREIGRPNLITGCWRSIGTSFRTRSRGKSQPAAFPCSAMPFPSDDLS